MRQTMETAPKDGKPVVLENDIVGTYELAEWSERECAWIGKNGKPVDISPRYWHPVHRSDPASIESRSNGLLQAGEMFRRSMDRAEAPPLVPAALPLDLTHKSASAAVPLTDNQGGSRLNMPPQQSRRRLAICCGLGMIVASLCGALFRSEVTSYFQAKAALAAGQREAEGAILATPMVSNEESTRESNSSSVVEALENELSNLRQELSINSVQHRQARAEALEREAQIKRTAEIETSELRQSLRQARDKIVNLEKELTLAKQHMSRVALPGREDRRTSRQQAKQRKPDGFFGEDSR